MSNKKIIDIISNGGIISEGIKLVRDIDTDFVEYDIAPYFIIFDSGVLPIPIRNDNDIDEFLKPSPMLEVLNYASCGSNTSISGNFS
ncbi:hypothetical protein [Flavobacterium sp.]|uniref:hypothetical protein n=1 Tax=Flavobacterium sp. TaxID=239 RepID=UPI00263384DA|nr:hypothetical protein [Flavobacterium sp.]